MLDLFNKQIIGFSAGIHIIAGLAYNAFATVKTDLHNIQIFHTDGGSEFNSSLLDDVISAFNIRRSLSFKGCPYDNSVAEFTFKMIKADFVYERNSYCVNVLKLELADYDYWFNYFKLHNSLGYFKPMQFEDRTLTNLSV